MTTTKTTGRYRVFDNDVGYVYFDHTDDVASFILSNRDKKYVVEKRTFGGWYRA